MSDVMPYIPKSGDVVELLSPERIGWDPVRVRLVVTREGGWAHAVVRAPHGEEVIWPSDEGLLWRRSL